MRGTRGFSHGCRLVLESEIPDVAELLQALVSWLSVSVTREFRIVRRFSLQFHRAYFLGEFYFYDFWVLSTTGHIGPYLPCIASTCDATLLFPLFWSCWMETALGRFGNDEQLRTCRCGGARRTASRDLWYRLRDLSLAAFVVSCAILLLQRGSRMPELLLLAESGTSLVCPAFTETLARRKVFFVPLGLESAFWTCT